MNEKVLDLVLKGHWYDKIIRGEKTHEYREVKPYWEKRFQRDYDLVRFRRGYTNITATFKIKSIKKTREKNDLNLPECFDIELGEQIKE